MLKKHMAACLVVTAFAAAPAFAQTSTSPSAPTDRPAATGSGSTATGSSAMQPGAAGGSSSTGASSMGSSSMGQSGAMQGQFMTQIQPNQLMASKLIGTRVVSANNESIGDINDVVVDRNGQAVAAVVGVGGFLGIGEKDVAVPFNSLEFASDRQASAMSGNNNAGGSNVTTTGSTATGTTGATGTSGSGSMAGSNASSASGASSDNTPDRVVLRMTKAELQAAPAFNTRGSNDNANRSTSGTTGTSGGTGAGGQSGSTTSPQQ